MKNPTTEVSGATIMARAKHSGRRRERRAQEIGVAVAAAALPEDRRLADLLGCENSRAVKTILKHALLQPVAELTDHPGKRIRAQLVSFSYRLLNGDLAPAEAVAKRCRSCAEVVELIHAGSLVIDDIEDGSTVRRGRPAMHARYGMPVALNAGNWLYFWPLEVLKEIGFGEDDLTLVYERYHRTLLRAHFGQALDIGARVDTLTQAAVAEVCLTSMRLKTGALMGFAALLGGVLADVSETSLAIIEDFGRDLGVALQMFDDLGNVIGKCEPSKRYEDLILARPSWVWACAAQNSAPEAYDEFVVATRKLPDAGDLQTWIERYGLVQQTRQSARAQLKRCFDQLKRRLSAGRLRWSVRALDELYALGEEIAVAYG